MKTKMSKVVACGILLASGVAMADAAESEGFSYTPGEGVSYNENPVVKGEFGVAFDSRYMTYGVIDGKDPIVTPAVQLTFADWVYVGASAIFDTTKGNGKRGGYGNRAGKYTTLDMTGGLAHDFNLGEHLGNLGEYLGNLSVDFNYIYEYLPRHDGSMDDTQYLNLELSLGDLWFEPTFLVERDLMADDGTYFNFNVGHAFGLVAGETAEDDPVVSFKPSIGQGWGNRNRLNGYDMGEHGGFMDTTLKGELAWIVNDCLSLSAYVAYSDYWIDRNTREGARDHNAAWGSSYDRSWNVYGGVALTAKF